MNSYLDYIYQEEDNITTITQLFTSRQTRHVHLYNEGVKKMETQRRKQEEYQIEKLIYEITNYQTKKYLAPKDYDNFYDYNMKWQRQKMEKIISERTKAQDYEKKPIEKTIKMYDLKDYLGPISGWNQRVKQFLDKKNIQPEPCSDKENLTFNPKLEKKSIAIFNNMPASEIPVLQRFKEYQEITDMKKEKMKLEKELEEEKNCTFRPEITYAHSDSLREFENLSVERKLLLKGELIKKRKEDKIQEELESIPFKPQTNNYILTKEREPLHVPKKKPEEPKKNLTTEEIEEKKRIFEDFVTRNYKLEKEKARFKAIQNKEYLAAKEMEGCTFKPNLDKRSVALSQMDSERSSGSLYERNLEFKKRIETESEKIKFEITKAEQEECTFKPKLLERLDINNASGYSSQKLYKPNTSYSDLYQKNPISQRNNKFKTSIYEFLEVPEEDEDKYKSYSQTPQWNTNKNEEEVYAKNHRGRLQSAENVENSLDSNKKKMNHTFSNRDEEEINRLNGKLGIMNSMMDQLHENFNKGLPEGNSTANFNSLNEFLEAEKSILKTEEN